MSRVIEVLRLHGLRTTRVHSAAGDGDEFELEADFWGGCVLGPSGRAKGQKLKASCPKAN